MIIVVPIIQNSMIILALATIYEMVYRLANNPSDTLKRVLIGVLVALMIVIMQLTPISYIGAYRLHLGDVLLIYASLMGGALSGGIALGVFLLFEVLIQGSALLIADMLLAVILTGFGYALRVGYKQAVTAYRLKDWLAIWVLMIGLHMLVPLIINTPNLWSIAPDKFGIWVLSSLIGLLLTAYILKWSIHWQTLEQANQQHREYESFLAKSLSDDIYQVQFDATGKIADIRGLFHRQDDAANVTYLKVDAQNNWVNTIYADDLVHVDPVLEGLARGEPISIKMRIKLKNDHDYRWRQIYGVPLMNKHTNQLERAYFLVKDIQAEKIAEKEREEAQFERERVKILKAFSVQTEHQFRTPLSSIHTNLYLIRKVTDEGKRDRYLDNIEKQAHLLLELVESLNLLTQIEIRDQLTIHNIQLNEVVQGLLPIYINKAEEKSIEITSTLDPTLPRLYANHQFIKASVLHLLRNAVSYTPAGGKIHIQTQLCQDEAGKKHAELVVQDTGVGMSETVKKHAFERFFRADVAQTTAGLGLGLPLVYEVAQHYGGEVLIDSAVGAGTTVTLRLPLA